MIAGDVSPALPGANAHTAACSCGNSFTRESATAPRVISVFMVFSDDATRRGGDTFSPHNLTNYNYMKIHNESETLLDTSNSFDILSIYRYNRAGACVSVCTIYFSIR